ncbi:MAG: hypothetical protein P8127_15025, partial [Acidobacteriota bacterium]
EIEFKGNARDGCGNELSKFVGEVLRETKPAGILLNFSSFKITSWDDIGRVFTQLVSRESNQFRPICIVARKRTAGSLKALFKVMQIQGSLAAEYFDQTQKALESLRETIQRARTDGPMGATGRIDELLICGGG